MRALTPIAVLLCAAPCLAQDTTPTADKKTTPNAATPRPARARPAPEPAPYTAPARVKVDGAIKDEAIKKCVEILLKLQEGDNKAEWPYEGVYRVAGTIPWGYRVGG